MNQPNIRETKKVSREDALEMVRDTKQKLKKILFLISPDVVKIQIVNAFNERIYLICIWLDIYSDSFNKEVAVETDELEKVADVETIHNDNLKLDYRINYLASISARLMKYGSKSTNQEELHAILKALDYCKEAIGYLELMK